MTAILQIVGKPDTGKTTLTHLLVKAIHNATVLLIDATPDAKLAHRFGPDKAVRTLASMLQQAPAKALSDQEAIDWAFNDLPVSIGPDADLVTVGDLPETLSALLGAPLRYGLQRLLKGYDFVIIDGYHPGINGLISSNSFQTLVVITPRHPALPADLPTTPTPFAILNRYDPEAPESASLDYAVAQGDVRLIGRLPNIANDDPDALEAELSTLFQDCLLRLDFVPLQRL